MPIDPRTLDKAATRKTAKELVNELGELAGFLLNSAILTKADRDLAPPPLPAGPGACWPVIGVRRDDWLKLLSPAFPLPVRWTKRQAHDLRLPPDLRVCADSVMEAWELASGTQAVRDYRLGFAESEREWPDLSLFDIQYMTADSCFPALAMGLHSAVTGVAPFSKTWASAKWDRYRFEAIDLLPQKLQAAARWGAESFYVAMGQTLSDLVATPVTVKRLKSEAKPDPSASLAPYFTDGLVEPDSESWEDCRRYHDAIRQTDRERAIYFYEQVLCRHIIKRCRIRVVGGQTAMNARPKVMVSIVTHAREPVPVLLGVLDVHRVLLLYTLERSRSNQAMRKRGDSMRVKAKQLRKHILGAVPDCRVQLAAFCYDIRSPDFPYDFRDSLRTAIAAFTKNHEDSEVVFDIDRGTTLHKLALAKFVIRPNHWLTTIYHEMQRGAVRHGSERVILWRADDGWEQPFLRLPERC
jgi:hypothetical protein